MSKTQSLGRPATVKGRPITINIDDLTRSLAAKLGNGNVSAGLRFAVAVASGLPAASTAPRSGEQEAQVDFPQP